MQCPAKGVRAGMRYNRPSQMAGKESEVTERFFLKDWRPFLLYESLVAFCTRASVVYAQASACARRLPVLTR